MTEQNARQGIILMIVTTFIFAVQDGISRHLASEYNIFMVVMIRYWFFGAFVIALAQVQFGGLRQVVSTKQPFLQAFRGLLLITEICIMVAGFVYLGLVESHAIFAGYPLVIAALSGPVLGERVGWRRWTAIGVGCVGMLIILQPGVHVFSAYALIPFLAAVLFALYGLLTRYAARKDTAATSFFWTGAVGSVGMTFVGVWFWEPMSLQDWYWMGALCITGAAGHYTLIRCYAVAEAGTVQPFAYLQLVFASTIGLTIFDESLRWPTVLGGGLIILAGMFTIFRERSAA